MTRARVCRGLAVALIAAGIVSAWAPTAGSAGTASVRIREAHLESDGNARVVVSVTGVSAPIFSVSESGENIADVSAKPLIEQGAGVAVALLIDTSGSMKGRPMSEALAAAKAFVSSLPRDVAISLVSFADKATIRVPLTTQHDSVNAAISSLTANGGTALYDGVTKAASALASATGQRNIVLFSDGGDTASKGKLATAIQAAKAASSSITAVGLKTAALDAKALNALASQTRGLSLSVGDPGKLSAAFAGISEALVSQYVLSYHVSKVGPKELDLSVSAAGVADHIALLNPRTQADLRQGPVAVSSPHPLVPAFAGKVGLWVGLFAAFLFALLLIRALLRAPSARNVQRTLAIGAGKHRPKATADSDDSSPARAAMTRATELMRKIPNSQGYQKRVQAELERSGWPLRATEFLLIQAGAGGAGLLLGTFGLGNVLIGLVLGVVLAAAPRMILQRRASSRTAAFLTQLPDTLQLLSGSLQAGYGFMQAVDTLVKECAEPTASEFARVLSESRLGMPFEESMAALAERIGSDDFKWVVLAINIQRQVGGNLATLLETVSQTLREREALRRQIKALSAEGRLSGWILGVLPFAIAGYTTMVNPGYLGKMFHDPLGQMMIAGGLVLMAVGVAWMRKIVRIDV